MATKPDIYIARWLEEDKEDCVDGPAGSDDDIDHIEEELESNDSEYSSEKEEDADATDLDWETVFNAIDGNPTCHYLGLEGTKWMKYPIEGTLKMLSNYVPNFLPGPRDHARARRLQHQCFRLFFDEHVISMITSYTNLRIAKTQKKFARARDAKATSELEITALIGILFLSGCTKTNQDNFLQLFESKKGIGMEAVYLAMSYHRYRFLMNNLRFSDPKYANTALDKMAPIRMVFRKVVDNFQKHFNPSHELNLGDIMIPYKGRCSFRQHTPKKFVKNGIKMFALVDTQYPYTYNLELYIGDNPGHYQVSNRKIDIIMRMTDPIKGEYRNVTMNNWFTNLETAEILFERKITIVGAIKPNNKEVPRVFRTIKDKGLHSSLFGFNTGGTLVQYVHKPDKAVLLLSSKHYDVAIDSSPRGQNKPEILNYYNRTKYSVDTMDAMCAKYDVSRNSRRWPLVILFRLLNIAAINALCIYTINRGEEKSVRRDFQTELGLDLLRPLLHKRLHSETLPDPVKRKLVRLLYTDVPPPNFEFDPDTKLQLNDLSKPRGHCHVCRRVRMNTSTRDMCIGCAKFTCEKHGKPFCTNCKPNPK